MSGQVYVAGVGSTTFSKHPNRSLVSLGAEAARAALSDSRIPVDAIGALFVGNFVGGIMTGQELLAPIIASELGLSYVEAMKLEDACASSAAGIRLAFQLVGSGQHHAVLVVGVERLTGAPRDVFTAAMTAAIDNDNEGAVGVTFPGFWGLVMNRHMYQYGTTREQVAAVTVKNRRFGVRNPLAQFRKEVSFDEVLSSDLIADPICKFDCCPSTDGAAALVIASEDLARKYSQSPVRIVGSALVTGPARVTGYRDITVHDGTVEAARRAYEMAGVDPEDIDVAEMHDCCSIAEIVDSEDLGFFAKGEGGPAALAAAEGRRHGRKVVINPSGGLLSKGHPVGATGCGQAYEIVQQLRECHSNQVEGARIGLTHNAGGTAAVVTIHIFEKMA